MPFPNEHAARIQTPNQFVSIVQLQKLPNGIRILGGPLKTDPKGPSKLQSYRFPKDRFTPAEAQTWLKEHNIKVILFEPASAPQAKFDFYDNLCPKYIQNINKESADIFIFDDIGNGGIDGQEFANEMKMLNDFNVKLINIFINSSGGSVFHGHSIFAAIQESKAEVHTHIKGIAASIAAIIAVAGDRVFMADYGRLMFHNLKGSENPDEKEQNAIDSLKGSQLTILKNKTGKSEKELSAMMDKETWFNPKEALEGGFIDEIVSTKKTTTNRMQLSEIVNFLKVNKKNMIGITKLLDLNEDATEASIVEAIQSIQNELSKANDNYTTKEKELVDANKTITSQKDIISQFEVKQKELNKAVVEETIETAVKDGKFDEKDKEDLVKEFEGNLTGLKMIVGKLRTPAQIISNQLNGSNGSNGSGTIVPKDKKDWGFRKLEKDAPTILTEIKKKNPELFKSLFKAEYNVDFEEIN